MFSPSALKTFPLIRAITYGPIPSRRFGLSLGVNLLPPGRKACSFDCPYCQLGRARPAVSPPARLPSVAEVEAALRRDLTWFKEIGLRPDTITFSGNGEPTLHPGFEEIVERARALREELSWMIPIAVLTNAAHLDRPDVVRALNRVDTAAVKLDAGTEAIFQKINRPRRELTLRAVIEGIRKLNAPVVQTMFARGPVDNSGDREVGAWIERLKEIDPWRVQIYTLDRVPADPEMRPVGAERLKAIAARVGFETGVIPEVEEP